jgi:hypothetical protein
MANIEVKLRRGTTSQHAGFTGAVGEVTVDTDKDTVVVHDGSTAGGHELRKKADTIAGSEIDNDAVTPAKISSTDTLLNVNDTHQTIGLGILANATDSFPKVKMDGGVQVGNQAPSLTSINSELSVTGNGNLNLLTVENTSSTSTDQSVVVVKGPVPTLQLNDTVAPTDQGVMKLNMTGGELRFTQISDDTLTTTDLVKIKPDEMTVENGTGVAKIKIINTNASGGGASLKLQSNVAPATDEGDYSLYIGGANGKFNITNENTSKTVIFDKQGAWYPSDDYNASTNPDQALGQSANRWSVVYANTGTISTSDRNEKEEIEDLSEAELRVATAIKGLIKKFKFKGRVRKHIGVIAQDVEAAFTAEGLNASEYGLFCSDTFEDENGVTTTRLGIRYEELLAFVIAAM